jgi:hypothetical protein
MPAVEGLWAGLETLGRIGNLSVTADQRSEAVAKIGPSTARATLIANESTEAAMSRFYAALNSKGLALMAIRNRIEAEQMEMNFWMEEVNALQAANAQHLSRWQERSTTGQAFDPVAWQRGHEQFQERSSKVKDLLERHGQRNEALFKRKMELLGECMEAASEISELLSPLLGSMRAELGLPFDLLVFSKQLREAQAKAREDMQAYLKALHAIVDDVVVDDHQDGE